MSTEGNDDIVLGDIVAVNHGMYGRKEGLVVGSTIDYAGRQVVEIQFEPGEVYKTWYPNVRRVRRTVSYSNPVKHRAIERTIYW
ncbi:hypothetical protein EW145_g8318 [Phellinidium pouzarii]|uniref:Hypervirulence associated protein TUDOR domain-containing protein n=1 Tax=Phellinidium pouzarii TaxID=167371 RepID=A0A4S4K744_9AGAM|nr:hypothetical protein EW145_g8318 [Phellinidium pouzarii]